MKKIGKVFTAYDITNDYDFKFTIYTYETLYMTRTGKTKVKRKVSLIDFKNDKFNKSFYSYKHDEERVLVFIAGKLFIDWLHYAYKKKKNTWFFIENVNSEIVEDDYESDWVLVENGVVTNFI